MGSAVRLATVMYATTDPLYQLQFLSSVFLNATISIQCLLYWNNKLGGGDSSKAPETKQHYAKVAKD